jgi:hypothetical protein
VIVHARGWLATSFFDRPLDEVGEVKNKAVPAA